MPLPTTGAKLPHSGGLSDATASGLADIAGHIVQVDIRFPWSDFRRVFERAVREGHGAHEEDEEELRRWRTTGFHVVPKVDGVEAPLLQSVLGVKRWMTWRAIFARPYRGPGRGRAEDSVVNRRVGGSRVVGGGGGGVVVGGSRGGGRVSIAAAALRRRHTRLL